MRKILFVALITIIASCLIYPDISFAAKKSVSLKVSCIMPQTATATAQLSQKQQPQTQIIQEKTYHDGQLVLLKTVVAK
jgi:uncharacterized membrane protein